MESGARAMACRNSGTDRFRRRVSLWPAQRRSLRRTHAAAQDRLEGRTGAAERHFTAGRVAAAGTESAAARRADVAGAATAGRRKAARCGHVPRRGVARRNEGRLWHCPRARLAREKRGRFLTTPNWPKRSLLKARRSGFSGDRRKLRWRKKLSRRPEIARATSPGLICATQFWRWPRPTFR